MSTEGSPGAAAPDRRRNCQYEYQNYEYEQDYHWVKQEEQQFNGDSKDCRPFLHSETNFTENAADRGYHLVAR